MSFIHERAIVDSAASVGSGTRVWAFAHVLPEAVIGKDCNICDGVFVEGGARIGDRVTVKCGVQIWSGVVLGDDVFVGPNVTFTNDPFPRSKKYPEEYSKTIVMKGASIGANATILPGISIGSNAMIGAGAVVTKNVPSNAVVMGNPATIRSFVDAVRVNASSLTKKDKGPVASEFAGCSVYELPEHRGPKGALSLVEVGQTLPFAPERTFWIYDVPTKEMRGQHAHRKLHQFLVCLHGSVVVCADNGSERAEVVLDCPSRGLHIPPQVWGSQYLYSDSAVLLVFASGKYDPHEYMNNYEEFLAEVRR